MPEQTNYEKAMDLANQLVRPQKGGAVEYKNADATGTLLALLAIADELRALVIETRGLKMAEQRKTDPAFLSERS